MVNYILSGATVKRRQEAGAGTREWPRGYCSEKVLVRNTAIWPRVFGLSGQ